MRRAAILMLGLVFSGCAPAPRRVADAVFAEIAAGSVEAALAAVADDYQDPVGDRARLASDLRAFVDEQRPLTVGLVDVSTIPGPGPGTAELLGRLEVETQGRPSWSFRGPLRLGFLKRGQASVISTGLLDDLRGLRALFEARRRALEANDVDGLIRLLDPAYADGDLDRAAVEARLRDEVPGTPIRMEPESYWVEVRGLEAHVDERYALRLGDDLHRAIGRFTVRKTGGTWRLSAGLLK